MMNHAAQTLPIISPTLTGLAFPMWIYATSRVSFRITRTNGWWRLTPNL